MTNVLRTATPSGLLDHDSRTGSAGSMSDIGRAFARDLAAWQARYAGRPELEMLRLCLLALEREENVAVAYDATVLGPRLAALPIAGDVRELMRRALVWVWRDEEMHARYVREMLLKVGDPLVSARTFVQQMAGAVGGWTVAVRQHRRWSDAPLARAAATLLIWAGALTGRVPREVQRHLDYCSFRDFCRYNVHTEGTAWQCWRRMTELVSRVPALEGARADFARIAADEARHRRIFQILGEALTDDDRLQAGVSADSLAARLGALGE